MLGQWVDTMNENVDNVGGRSPILRNESEMPRFKEEERERAVSETRQALLDAAAEEFARGGFQGANINQISRAAGYAKGTIYNYFESKRALMVALIQDTARIHLEVIRQGVIRERDPARRVSAFFEAGFDFVTRYQSRGRAIVNNLFGPDVGFKQEMYEAYQPMFELVGRDIVSYGSAQGSLRNLDPRSTANLLMLVYLGVASQLSPQGQPWIEAEQVSDHMLHGLLNRTTSQASEL